MTELTRRYDKTAVRIKEGVTRAYYCARQSKKKKSKSGTLLDGQPAENFSFLLVTSLHLLILFKITIIKLKLMVRNDINR